MSTEAERLEIERELAQLQYRHPLPWEPHIWRYHARIEALVARLQTLKGPEPVTGERAGALTITGFTLGGIAPVGSYPVEEARNHHSCTLDYGGAYPWDDED